jgi:predicted nucleic acid-binding protein
MGGFADRRFEAPLLVCKPVLAEAMHLLARLPTAQDALLGFLESGALDLAFRIGEHVAALRRLHKKYRGQPMSLADVCIVRMAELHDQHVVLMLDSDFSSYRSRADSGCARSSGRSLESWSG